MRPLLSFLALLVATGSVGAGPAALIGLLIGATAGALVLLALGCSAWARRRRGSRS